MPPDECLREDVVARLVEGSLDGEELASAERHLASCATCTRLVADVGSALTSGDGEDGAPPLSALVRGAQVGRYVIVEPIGAGGMGRVYAALDPALERKVALKLLHRHATAPELEARLLREAKAMARLEHPEVITVHDVGRYGEQLFIAMELVDGGTLREWLAKERRSWREVLGVFLRAGRGLAQAHASGIVHRDFKPDNVLVGTDGRVRVTDFGLALTVQGQDISAEAPGALDLDAAAPLTRTGMFVGTPAYMAPELMQGKPADARSDLYGFCVALWEALYGERPFQGKTLAALQAARLAGKPHAKDTDRVVPARVRRALVTGLRPRPEDRPASMDALLGALEEATRARFPWVAAGGVVAVTAAVVLALSARQARPKSALVAHAPAGCAANAECVDEHGGAPWICRAADRTCVPLDSEDCTPLFEPADVRAKDTVWLGALFPTKGPRASLFGTMNLDGAELARREIAAATAALAGSGASVRVPRIGLVACDDSANPMRAARHLVDDVGVPAILGFGSGREVVEVAGSFLIARQVLTMATLTQSPAITRLPQAADLPRMVWRTTSSIEAAAEATAHFIDDVLAPRAAVEARVALVRADDAATPMPFGEILDRELARDAGSALGSPRYVEVTLPNTAPTHEAALVFARRIATARSQFVVLLVEQAWMAALAAAIEEVWPRGPRRPAYVIAIDSTSVLRDFFGTSAERRHRVFALSSVAMPTETERFLLRFDAAHPGEATATLHPGTTYDAFYALAYATFALGDEPPSGPGLARGLARLAGGGPKIQNGPTDLFKGIAALSKGERIDLSGPSGALDFDPTTGEVVTDFALLCPALGAAADDVESGVVYRSSERRTVGTPRCP